ncbi:fumarylacetoacetate hydrolase family protein [Chelatococcus asaccharovorans]|uniref:2-keto-4-pentenoate hydratase/2-oxohepta-3-ene-1,7-dioic acid hydratase in catechol pathway n=1 Tax=Chelatococcus asaccharovorans TaxID=28210 RepID=A0A2V3TVX8_9HYPH|nr:fumarylacetoacetate hydrolase family protein [Chelatococcus asaccharovorans]MBS7706124.1 fumarylacetoacetate hydrolase family protein [Chelatococcus asaccharovorans]PXW52494.1 2-keto-4-pentenoate hydratase/2-oxohepta-3-ene-1,7-dioic acid hydratase in catechol pathway [Chelatococcus asaccharovorans]CAH1659427.1 putative fumarylacetoacetate (FAA) hydrolase [Chelatococcus asaccharovorans]CAH1687950.1 putative fumarylacetoacetate (FAA) hydrolase [Chelatococcus asaccharovorans]
MKLISFTYDGRDSWGAVQDDVVVDLGAVSAASSQDLRGAIADGLPKALPSSAPRIPLSEITFAPVIPNPDKIFCVGINYASHIAETNRPTPTHPVIFMRVPASQVGHGQPILRPSESVQLDFEGELAVVIGKPVRRVAVEHALDAVAGYSCYNDGSVRDWQRHSSQFAPGKNFFQTGGFGPWLVTADEIEDPAALTLTTRLNGTVMQQAPISDLVFGVAQLISYCSIFTPLVPGDVIVTGTTGGVGLFRDPPVFMKAGDTVEVEISQIGTLANTVADD